MPQITPTVTTVQPAKEIDDRPLISDLLKKHSTCIRQVREKLEKHETYDANRYDDIWILRFVLSYKGVMAKAAKAAKDTMKFRHKHGLNDMGDIRAKIFDHENIEGPHAFSFYPKAHTCMDKNAMMQCLPDPDRGVVCYTTVKGIKMQKIVDDLTSDDLFLFYLYQNEAIQQINDAITRRTGKLTKMLRIMDVTNFNMSELSFSYLRKDTAVNRQLEDCYPQSLGAFLMVNPPSWVANVYKMFKPLMPKRFNDKFSLVTPSKDSEDGRKFLSFVSLENLPERYGGENTVWPPPCAGARFA